MEIEVLRRNVKEQIRNRRWERDWSLSKLGRCVGAAPAVVWQWEQGVHLPSVENLVRLSEVFCCSLDDLCGGVK